MVKRMQFRGGPLEAALLQAAAATAGGALVLQAEPLHHVAGVAAVAAAQAEVGGSAHGHVAHGALEGQPLAHRALGAPRLAPTVAAVHTELCRAAGGCVWVGGSVGVGGGECACGVECGVWRHNKERERESQDLVSF